MNPCGLLVMASLLGITMALQAVAAPLFDGALEYIPGPGAVGLRLAGAGTTVDSYTFVAR